MTDGGARNDVRIGLLGPLTAEVGGTPVPVKGRRPRTLLSVLALSAGEPVSFETLVNRVWGEEALPHHVRGSLHTYVMRLRRTLGRDLVVTTSAGYLLDLPRTAVDALRLLDLVRAAETADTADDLDRARQYLAEAVGLWRGAPFDERLSDWLDESRSRLSDAFLTALERLAAYDVAAGSSPTTVDLLRDQAAQHPMRESLWARLLVALGVSGRQAEALTAYEEIRVRLRDELGVDPAAELQEIHAALLAGDLAGRQGVDAPDRPAPEQPGPAVPELAAPRELPADLDGFTGRAEQLAELDRLFEGPAKDWPGIVAVHGSGAVGKTTLAVHWAHRVRHHFPDGQLFLDLRGYGPGCAMTPAAALATLLTRLAVPRDQVPADIDEASALWRTTLAGRRLLIVLDNARDAQQVRPLLPGPDSLVLLTSRSQMRGLAAREGARQVAVDTLECDEATALLRARLAHLTIPLGDAALCELVNLCGRLPLALSLAAERCGRELSGTPDELVVELRGETDRLGTLATADDPLTDLRAVFSWSYQALAEDAARMFRLLGLHPGGGVSVPAAAALAGIPARRGGRILDRLAEASLVRVVRPGRYVLHDLLGEYAAELAAELDPPQERQAAVRRLVSWYLHTTANAQRQLLFGRAPRLMYVGEPDPDVEPSHFDDARQATAWLDGEWPTLSLLVGYAAGHGLPATAYRLTNKLFSYLVTHRPPGDAAALQEIALEATRTVGNRLDEAFLRNQLGTSWARLGDDTRALEAFRAAWATFRQRDHPEGRGMTAINLAQLLANLGRYDEALEHFEECLVLAERIGDDDATGSVLSARADAYYRMGRYADAVDSATRGLAVFRKLGQHRDEAITLGILGSAHAALGQPRRAEEFLRGALRSHRANGSRWGEAIALARLGRVALESGRRELARESAHRALALVDDAGVLDSTELSRADLVELLEQAGGVRAPHQGVSRLRVGSPPSDRPESAQPLRP